MIPRRFTEAQKKALAWFPDDQSWCRNPGRLVYALNSLALSHRDCVESEWGDFGPRGGRELRWRLTAHGVTVCRSVL